MSTLHSATDSLGLGANREDEHHLLLRDLSELAIVGELTVEDFSVIHARYRKLVVAGLEFAPEFALLMKLLETQATHTDDDPDSDMSVDDGQEDEGQEMGW